MEMNEYTLRSAEFNLLTDKSLILRLSYLTLGLSGESGEVCNKFKKVIRDNKSIDELKSELKSELGDVLWYLANLSAELGFSLQEIAELNLQKLEDRKSRDVLSGSGDNR